MRLTRPVPHPEKPRQAHTHSLTPTATTPDELRALLAELDAPEDDTDGNEEETPTPAPKKKSRSSAHPATTPASAASTPR
jgi:hypothetical protein